MTFKFHASADAIRAESALAILIPRRNVRQHRAATRFAILRSIGALRVLRSVA